MLYQMVPAATNSGKYIFKHFLRIKSAAKFCCHCVTECGLQMESDFNSPLNM